MYPLDYEKNDTVVEGPHICSTRQYILLAKKHKSNSRIQQSKLQSYQNAT